MYYISVIVQVNLPYRHSQSFRQRYVTFRYTPDNYPCFYKLAADTFCVCIQETLFLTSIRKLYPFFHIYSFSHNTPPPLNFIHHHFGYHVPLVRQLSPWLPPLQSKKFFALLPQRNIRYSQAVLYLSEIASHTRRSHPRFFGVS